MIATENESRLIEAILELVTMKGLAAPHLTGETVLEQIGLESLDFAQVVIRMEEITGKDPFATGADYQLRTVADLAALYD
jgi:hypothetical protein